MNVAVRKQVEKYLDERFQIALRTDERMGNGESEDFLSSNPDYIFYCGCLGVLANMNFACDRIHEGHHKLYER